MPKKQSEISIADSPLLSNKQNAMHSQINPDRFDMNRFSEMREEEYEENSMRIIIYVIVVIVIGVGLAFLARYYMTSTSDNNKQDTSQNTVDENKNIPKDEKISEKDDAITINTSLLSDSSAINLAKDNKDYVTDLTKPIGIESYDTKTTTNLDKIAYQKYQTFTRLSLEFSGINEINQIPLSNINLTDESLLIELNPSILINNNIPKENLINDLVNKLDINTNIIKINLREKIAYRLHDEGNTLIIDIKTIKQIEANEEILENEIKDTEEKKEVTNTTLKTSNSFSKDKQYITSYVKNNSIQMNEVYYEDIYGSDGNINLYTYFELAFGSRGNVGNNFIPNAQAELVETDSKTIIKLVIKNLEEIQFKDITIDDLSFDTSGINFINAKLDSFKDGTAEILVEIKKPAEFRLVSEPTVSGKTQVLALQIKD